MADISDLRSNQLWMDNNGALYVIGDEPQSQIFKLFHVLPPTLHERKDGEQYFKDTIMSLETLVLESVPWKVFYDLYVYEENDNG